MTRPRALPGPHGASGVALALTLAVGRAALAAPPGLEAAAAASPRPAGCRGPRDGALRWARARQPGLATHCDRLAEGYARLPAEPARALELATEAEAALPGGAGPEILRALAFAVEGRDDDVLAAAARARARAPGAPLPPSLLAAEGRAELRAGRLEPALARLRALVVRIDVLPDPAERSRALVEAGLAALALGPASLAEAERSLERALRLGVPAHRDLAVAALALARQRAGDDAAARELAAGSTGPHTLAEQAAARFGGAVVVPSGLLPALVAVLARERDPELAREAAREAARAPVNAAWLEATERLAPRGPR